MFRRVLVGRVVAAADMPAAETEPEMHPGAVHPEALLAALRRARSDVTYLVEMGALHTEEYPVWWRFKSSVVVVSGSPEVLAH
jgi:hypothetical protein